MRTLSVNKPHGFLIWRGKQKHLINKESLPVNEEIAIVEDGLFYGTALLSEPQKVDDSYLESNTSDHRLKRYELPEGDNVWQEIIEFKALNEALPARIVDGELELIELPEINEKQLEMIQRAKDLPHTIPCKSGAISITDKGAIGDITPELKDILDKNFEDDFALLDHFDDRLTMELYDLALVRKPDIKYKFVEPVNLHNTESPSVNCGSCIFHKQGLCKLYGVTTEPYQVCDSFNPEHKGLAVMLPVPINVAQRLVLTEKDVPMDSELVAPEDMHITLFYEGGVNPQRLIELPQLLHYLSQEYNSPFVDIQGIGKFERVKDGTQDVIKLGVDSIALKQLHTALQSYLGNNPDETRFSPHISLAYVPSGSAIPNVNYDRDGFVLPRINLNIGGVETFSANFKDANELYEDEVEEAFLAYEQKEAIKMPYEIEERDDQYCVVNQETGDTEGCYPNKEEADNLLTALRINVEGEEGKGKKEGRRLQGKWLAELKNLYTKLGAMLSWADREDDKEELIKQGFGIKETKHGPIFYTFSSNAFEDRDGEIITTRALEEFVAKNMENEDKGYFNFWHIPYTNFAQKQWQGVVGRVLIEAGPFLKNKNGRAALKFFKKYPKNHPVYAQEGWGASIEFKYLPEQRPSGVYEWLWITNTSVLPLSKAANINTNGGIKMKALVPEQEGLGKELLGEENFDDIITQGENLTKQLEKNNRYKGKNEDTTEATEEVEKEAEEEATTENLEEKEAVIQETEKPVSEEVEEEEKEDEEPEPETVPDEPVAEEEPEPDPEPVPAETPEEEPAVTMDEVVERVAVEVTKMLKDSMQKELEIIGTIPDELITLKERMSQYEEQAQVKKDLAPKGFASIFPDLSKMSAQNAVSEEEITEQDAKKKGPKENSGDDDSYGGPFFNSI